jgi:hypothetical protein
VVDAAQHDILEVSFRDLFYALGRGVVGPYGTIVLVAHDDELLVGCLDFSVFVEVYSIGVYFVGQSSVHYLCPLLRFL